MNKYGMLTTESKSDFDGTKKAEYYDESGFMVADQENKNLLAAPKKIEQSPGDVVK
jgi:hypothetical protein